MPDTIAVLAVNIDFLYFPCQWCDDRVWFQTYFDLNEQFIEITSFFAFAFAKNAHEHRKFLLDYDFGRTITMAMRLNIHVIRFMDNRFIPFHFIWSHFTANISIYACTSSMFQYYSNESFAIHLHFPNFFPFKFKITLRRRYTNSCWK